jgi:hypothetical protein
MTPYLVETLNTIEEKNIDDNDDNKIAQLEEEQ